MKKRKILYISMSIPYDNVPHAGGKTFNYYINGFANDIDNEVTMIAKVLPEEEHQIENINPNINTIIVRTPKNKVKKYISYIKSLNSKINPLYRYGNVLTKEIFNQIGNELDKLKNNIQKKKYLFNTRKELIIIPAALGNDAGIIGACQ
jgi:hypothetical protein